MSSMHRLTREIDLASPRETLFSFFADAANLNRITPRWLHFEILTPLPIEMRVGALIRYRLRLHGIPLRWKSRITAWEPPRRFVDTQLSGPFRSWIHEHTFEETASGCLVRDDVRYSVIGGWIVDRLLVRRDLEKIFAFRHDQLRALDFTRDRPTVSDNGVPEA